MRTWIDRERRKRKLASTTTPLEQSMDHLLYAINGYHKAWEAKQISKRQYLKRKEQLSILLHEDKALLVGSKSARDYPVAEEIDKALF